MALSEIWTIKYGDVTKTAAEWEISEINRSRTNQGKDVVTMLLDGKDVDDEPPFPDESIITIYRSGVPWFYGVRVDSAGVAGPGEESGDIVFNGPWWWLENIIYQQDWFSYTAGANELAKNSHLTLNMVTDSAGTVSKLSTKGQIEAVIAWALECIADVDGDTPGLVPFQLDTTDIPAANVPVTEVRDIMCSQVIQQQLRWTPNAVVWFDYSTTPPTLKIKPRASITDAALSLAASPDDADMAGLQITPRYDIQVPEVVLKYEQVNYTNGIAYTQLILDAYPVGAIGRKPKAFVGTIDLRGLTVSQSTNEIVAETINAESTDTTLQKEWWQAKLPWLAGDDIENLTIASVTRETAREYELFGQVSDWMTGTTGEEVIEAVISYDVKDDSGTHTKVANEKVSTRTTTTTLTTGKYSKGGVTDYGEAVPSGLAEWYYNQVNPLHFEGEVTLTEEECDSAICIGNALNITDGKAAWATMRAIVQTVTEQLTTGSTRIKFGPPTHLGPSDIIELMRVSQQTRRTSSSQALGTGQAYASSSIDLGYKNRVQDTSKGAGLASKLTVKGTAAGSVVIDAASANGKELTLREISVCDKDATTGVLTEKKIMILASEPY